MKPVSITPAYVAFYPMLAEIARKHGYALAVHGSVARDMDLVAIPWTEDAKNMFELINALSEYASGVMSMMFSKAVCLHGPEKKPHGRMAWTLTIGNAAVLDVSIVPCIV